MLSRWKRLSPEEKARKLAVSKAWRARNKEKVIAYRKRLHSTEAYKAYNRRYRKKYWERVKSDPVLHERYLQTARKLRPRYKARQKLAVKRWKRQLGRTAWKLRARHYYFKHRYGAEYGEAAFVLRELKKELKNGQGNKGASAKRRKSKAKPLGNTSRR